MGLCKGWLGPGRGEEEHCMQSDTGRRRVVIGGVKPEIDAGRFPIKRVLGEPWW